MSPEQVRAIAQAHGTPVYVYDEASLEQAADAMLAFPNAFGLTVRYAMKAWSNAAVLRYFTKKGLHIDASSGFEVRRAIAAGVPAANISLSTQELPVDIAEMLDLGISCNACSLHQLERIGREAPGARIGLRMNPGLGSGGTSKTNTGGPSSSFGIWHEDVPQIKELAERYRLDIYKVHSHIGSGSDPDVWQRVSLMTLALVEAFESVTVINLGGGFKVGRMPDEVSTDPAVVGVPVRDAIEAFAERTGRKLHLEVEPGTYMVANAGALLATVQDVTETGESGHRFLKLDAGMTDILRPSLYAAQHPMSLVSAEKREAASEQGAVVVGHCCESGDLLSPDPQDHETLLERSLAPAQVGDYLVIDGAGAYCSSMSTKNYNSFPELGEVWLAKSGEFSLIRRRQPVEQIWQNEVPLA